MEAQLPPVYGSPIFKNDFWLNHKKFRVALLTINNRQKQDPRFCGLLRALEEGKFTETDFEYLSTNCFISTNATKYCEFKNLLVPYVVSTKADCNRINSQFLVQKSREGDGGNSKPIIRIERKCLWKKSSRSHSLIPLDICTGAHVKLVVNLATDVGLTNGQQGVVKGILQDQQHQICFVE